MSRKKELMLYYRLVPCENKNLEYRLECLIGITSDGQLFKFPKVKYLGLLEPCYTAEIDFFKYFDEDDLIEYTECFGQYEDAEDALQAMREYEEKMGYPPAEFIGAI